VTTNKDSTRDSTPEVPAERRDQKVERRELDSDRRDTGRVLVENEPRRQNPERRG